MICLLYTSTFAECIALLGNPFILLMFVGIMCHVGIDVGTNTTAPKILMERLGVDIHAAAFATSLYFIFRTIGCLTGSLVLAHWAAKKFFVVSVVPVSYTHLDVYKRQGKWSIRVMWTI